MTRKHILIPPRAILPAAAALAALLLPSCRRALWLETQDTAQVVLLVDWSEAGETPEGCKASIYRDGTRVDAIVTDAVEKIPLELEGGTYRIMVMSYSESEYSSLHFEDMETLDNALPVGYSDGAYHFVVEVLRSDYEQNRTVQAWMLTNTTRSATTIRVRNKYFNDGSAAFSNSDRYVTSLSIRQRSFIVTNITAQSSGWFGRRYYNNIYFYYSTNTATSNRINSTAFELYANGFQEDVTLTFNRQMKSTDQIYMYNSDTSKGMLVTIEDLERGGLTITFS